MEMNIQLPSYCTLWQLLLEQQGQQKGMCIHILATLSAKISQTH